MDDEVLAGQLQHHWVGSTGGLAFFERVGRTHPDPDAAAEVRRMTSEIRAEREALREIMTSLGLTPSRGGALVARAAERVGRLKPNGRLLRRSPLTDLIELETLRDAVSGKRIGWQVLREVSEHDDRLDTGQFETLIERADSQLERLQDLHLRLARGRILR